ncbi:MAG TPA: GntR family transcriptional regulator [Candidatus Atribacteria bacterium]|nr:GntR family transcriptional regulator [Candidatus Atribacteria bacterium]
MAKIKNDRLVDLVYEKVKKMILDGALIPGEKINKIELANILGVSITPVNEVVNRLTGEKFIDKVNGSGYFVKKLTFEELKEFFAVRAGLEGIAIRLCINELSDKKLKEFNNFFNKFILPLDEEESKFYLKTDQEFHEKIINLCGNSIIIDFNKNFNFIMKSYQKGLIRPPEETLAEHREIIKSILERNGQKAQGLIMSHHLKSREVLKTKHLKY